jgi:hypothetical protein
MASNHVNRWFLLQPEETEVLTYHVGSGKSDVPDFGLPGWAVTTNLV